jgi:hypothetical protein
MQDFSANLSVPGLVDGYLAEMLILVLGLEKKLNTHSKIMSAINITP